MTSIESREAAIAPAERPDWIETSLGFTAIIGTGASYIAPEGTPRNISIAVTTAASLGFGFKLWWKNRSGGEEELLEGKTVPNEEDWKAVGSDFKAVGKDFRTVFGDFSRDGNPKS